jgi:2-oxoglutarate ferredoxin oxidoreductase subunit gamma
MIILGKMFRETDFCSEENLLKGIRKSVPARKAELYDSNVKAVRAGMSS